jgi:hypothetical protein
VQKSQWQHRDDDGHGLSEFGCLVLGEVRRDGTAAVVQGGYRARIGLRTQTDVDRPRGVEAKVGPVLGVARVELDRPARISGTMRRSLGEQPTLCFGDIVELPIAEVGIGVDDNTVQVWPQKIQHGGAHHGRLGAVNDVLVEREPRPLRSRDTHAAILPLALAAASYRSRQPSSPPTTPGGTTA